VDVAICISSRLAARKGWLVTIDSAGGTKLWGQTGPKPPQPQTRRVGHPNSSPHLPSGPPARSKDAIQENGVPGISQAQLIEASRRSFVSVPVMVSPVVFHGPVANFGKVIE